MHSFAPFLESIIENWGKKNLATVLVESVTKLNVSFKNR